MEHSSSEPIEKLADRLVTILRSYRRVAVALSGGVDSTVVAKAAELALGENAVAVTASSPSVADGEVDLARRLSQEIGIQHHVIQTSEFEDPDYVRNDGTRCYYCKSELYEQIAEHRESLGFEVICSGANTDDAGDYRPGLRAAAELGVRHPLQEAGFSKEMVREVAHFWELPNWEKPATPCLSSRIAVGVEVTPERTRRVDDAERYLRGLGLTELRVRYHPGDHARIEVPPEHLARFVDPGIRVPLLAHFRQLGFEFVSLDLQGFRSGSLNVLVPPEMLAASAVSPTLRRDQEES